jgi:hypothetical protein
MRGVAAREPKTWWVYVVKLDAAALFASGRCPSPDTKCVYVGQTSTSPRERFNRHKSGSRTASRVVRGFGVSLRSGLTEGPFDTEAKSLLAERRLANRLKLRKGYKVWGGQGRKLMASVKSKARATP